MSPALQLISEAECRARLPALPAAGPQAWTLQDGKLRLDLSFSDFTRAFAFMSEVALHAEKLDHHPGWFNSYGQLRIELMSHDAKGITERDFRLAGIIATIATRHLR